MPISHFWKFGLRMIGDLQSLDHAAHIVRCLAHPIRARRSVVDFWSFGPFETRLFRKPNLFLSRSLNAFVTIPF